MPIGRIRRRRKVINILDTDVPKNKAEKIKVPFELTPKQLAKLYKEYCIYASESDGYFAWVDCEEPCVLRKIPWIVGNKYPSENDDISRDLCFAIWHEGVIENELGIK